MSRFLEETVNLSVPQSGDIRTLLSEINYESDLAKETIVVPIGLKTDLGSIPQILQNVFPKDGKAMFAYILHDFLYQVGFKTRSVSDDMLDEAMKVLGVGYITRKSVRLGVFIGGWISWDNHRAIENKTPLNKTL